MASVLQRLMRAGNSLGVSLYRWSHGRIGGGARGLPVLLVTAPGRRTGLPHTVAVAYFEHDGGYLVVGSAGGAERDPQWFRNVRAADRVTVQIRDDVRELRPRVLKGKERERVWNDVVLARAPFFQKYADKSGRTLPLAVLHS